MNPVVAAAPSFFTTVGDLITAAIGWMNNFITEIVTTDTSGILITFCVALPLVGLGIGLLKRILNVRA